MKKFGIPSAVWMILAIGDSHTVGGFGRELDRLLRTDVPASEVATFGSCGSSPDWWEIGHPSLCGYWDHVGIAPPHAVPGALTPILEDLLTRLKPSVTIVELGANQVGNPREEIRAAAARTMKSIRESGSRCVWIGPPLGRAFDQAKFEEMYGALIEAANVEGCQLIDSRPWLTYPPTGGDGIHYDSLGPAGVAMAKGWAAKAFEGIRAFLP